MASPVAPCRRVLAVAVSCLGRTDAEPTCALNGASSGLAGSSGLRRLLLVEERGGGPARGNRGKTHTHTRPIPIHISAQPAKAIVVDVEAKLKTRKVRAWWRQGRVAAAAAGACVRLRGGSRR